MRRRVIPFLRVYSLVLRARRRTYLIVFAIVTVMTMLAHDAGPRLFGTSYQPSGSAGFWVTVVVFFWLADISVWYMVWLRVTSKRRDGLP